MTFGSYLLDTQTSNIGNIYVYKAVLTTTSTDLVIRTLKDTNKRIYVVGMHGDETSSSNITWKSKSSNLAGTISTTSGSAVITGTGTNFTNNFNAGDPFTIVCSGGDTLTILSVDSDIQMTATATSGFTTAGQTYYRMMNIITPELAASQGIFDKISGGYIFGTRIGDSLVANVSTAISEYLISVVEATSWHFPL